MVLEVELGELLRLQVPMVGKGVVESMMRVLVAVEGGGAEALAVQKAACDTLNNLAFASDNAVRVLVAGRCARAGCGCVLGARGDASALRMFGWRALCVLSCRFLFHCCCHARRLVSVCVFVSHHDMSVRCMFTLLHVHDWDVGYIKRRLFSAFVVVCSLFSIFFSPKFVMALRVCSRFSFNSLFRFRSCVFDPGFHFVFCLAFVHA